MISNERIMETLQRIAEALKITVAQLETLVLRGNSERLLENDMMALFRSLETNDDRLKFVTMAHSFFDGADILGDIVEGKGG